MSGPMQWSMNHGRLVPATGALPPADEEIQTYSAPLEPYPAPAPSRAPDPKPQEKKLAGLNVLKLAKARLKEVNAELRRTKALEKERGELERLIEAAKGRQVKNTAGRVIGTISPPKASAG